MKQGKPVAGGVILRSSRSVRRRNRRQVEDLPGSGLNFLRIDQAIAPNPDGVVCIGKVRQEVAACVVGDDDLGEFRRKVRSFRDDPDAGLRSVRAGDGPAEVISVDGDPSRGLAPR